MLALEPQLAATDGRYDLSLNDSSAWGFPEGFGMANGTYVRLGDPERGPIAFFFTIVPGLQLEESPAHGHASDNWRMSLRGVLPMGPDRYGPGQFRFHKGWKPYGSDSMPGGPDGGQAVLVFGDRRGTKIRPVKADSGPFPDERNICEWAGLAGDQVSDDPADGAGPTGLALAHAPIRGAHLNEAYNQSGAWPELLPGHRSLVALLGDQTCGPVMVLSRVAPGHEASPANRFGTETIRLVVEGTATIGASTLTAGDFRVQEAEIASDACIAGPDGLQELLLFGDRSRLDLGTSPWAAALSGQIVAAKAHLTTG